MRAYDLIIRGNKSGRLLEVITYTPPPKRCVRAQHQKAGVGVDALAWPLCFQPPKRLPFRSLAPRPSSRSAWPHAKTIAGKQCRSVLTTSFRVAVTCARTQHQSVSPSFSFRVALTCAMTPHQSVLLYAIVLTRTLFASAIIAHT